MIGHMKPPTLGLGPVQTCSLAAPSPPDLRGRERGCAQV